MSEFHENKYGKFLSVEVGAERREVFKAQAEAIALHELLIRLASTQGITPDLAAAKTDISVVAYYQLPEVGKNKLHDAALQLVPSYTVSSGYGGNDSISVNFDFLRRVMQTPTDPVAAAKRDMAYEHTLATALDLFDPVKQETLANLTSQAGTHPHLPWQRGLSELTRDIVRDFADSAYGDVADVARLRLTNECLDFFDYLVRANEIISERVEVLFAHGPNLEPITDGTLV